MAAEFDKTSFGIERMKKDITALTAIRQAMVDRMTFTTNRRKLIALQCLIAGIDEVLSTLTN